MFEAAGLAVMDLHEAGFRESPQEEALEVFASFEENARAKARYFAAQWDGPVVADDSGLEVAALGGAPGVRSKRWSGRSDLSGQALDEANNAFLLATLAPHTDRRARYVCVAAYRRGETEIVTRGETSGRILATPRGQGGFGYDPYFLSDELGQTFAECDREEKARVSHRGRAFSAMIAQLRAQR